MKHIKEQKLFADYESIAKKFFGVVVIFLFLFGFISETVLPDERDILTTNCRLFEASWNRILENGDKVPVEIPGTVDAEYGEVVTLTTTLPETIHYGECLCFRPIWQDVTIYVNGELRVEYTTENSRPFGTNSPMRYLFLELEESDAGKELTYQFSSNSKYAGNMRESYIGDRLSIWLYLLEESGVHMLITIFLLLMSLFCIIVCGILKFVYKMDLPLIQLAWTIFFCAVWMLSEITFRQILVKNISVLSCYAYWSLMMIPIPLLLFMNEIQSNRYRKVYFVPIAYSIIMLVVGTALQVFDIAQFVEQIPFIHGGLLVSIVCVIATISIDTVSKRISNYLFVGIGIYGMLLTAIIEMLFYYIGSSLSMGTTLAIGLLFLLVMAIIKTGQDLLQSEKKKQQAITAREAQAKFLANMSHEIRTPINAIIGMNELILRENSNKTIQDYAHNIQNASNMLLGLVNDVLDFTKIESGQLELVENTYHLATLIHDEMLLLNARTAGKNISTELEMDPRLPSCLWGDELRIKQVLTNLISNAAKYTNDGKVVLKVFFKQTDEDTIDLCFSVIDTGIGIKQEDLSQLFDSFKRLELDKNRTVQGTGLGLNIAKQLVNLMQGEITVESIYGQGSKFTISIPQKILDNQPIVSLEDALEKLKKETHTPESIFTAPDASVLVVDDNAMNLSLMKGLLKRSQMQVDVADSGHTCLELTAKKRYDIIFMDHMMPEMDGVETLYRIQQDLNNPNRNTIVIVLTANAVAGCREMYLEYGFHDYFSKPVQTSKLDAFLLQYLPEELIHRENGVSTKDADSKVTIASPTESSTSSTLEDDAFDLLYIDRDIGLSYCMDSEAFYQEMLSEFCKQARTSMSQMDNYFQKQDWKNYAVIAHGMKSSALSIGACNFSQLSLRHERTGKEGNADFILAEYGNYIATLEALIEKIEEML